MLSLRTMNGVAVGWAADIAGQRPVGKPSLLRCVGEQSSRLFLESRRGGCSQVHGRVTKCCKYAHDDEVLPEPKTYARTAEAACFQVVLSWALVFSLSSLT